MVLVAPINLATTRGQRKVANSRRLPSVQRCGLLRLPRPSGHKLARRSVFLRLSTPAQWFWPVAAAILPPTDPCWPGSAAEHVPYGQPLWVGSSLTALRVERRNSGRCCPTVA